MLKKINHYISQNKLIDIDARKRPMINSSNLLILHTVNQSDPDNVQKLLIQSLNAFRLYSQNKVDYLNTNNVTKWKLRKINFNNYDFVITHHASQCYTIYPNHLTKKLAAYKGTKIFFTQDDYDNIERNIKKYKDCKIDILYSPVSNPCTLRYLYPKDKMTNIKIKHYLTGYTSDDVIDNIDSLPICERRIDVFYRGNDVGWAYGRLGYEKQEIGIKMRQYLKEKHFEYDISCKRENQVFGDEYYIRMSSAKATLITESGSSIIFNNDKLMSDRMEIMNLSRSTDKLLSYEKLKAKYKNFFSYEEKYSVTEISPKCFEAIACKTALIGYEGNYSNVLIPNKHFIVLKKNFSNIESVLEKLRDDNYLQNIVNQAYQDIFVSNKYSYKSFIENFEQDLD